MFLRARRASLLSRNGSTSYPFAERNSVNIARMGSSSSTIITFPFGWVSSMKLYALTG